MFVLLSPAKTLNYEDAIKAPSTTQPLFKSEAHELVSILKKSTSTDIQQLMSVSEKIASLNVKRFKSFSKDYTPKNSRAALLAFRGDVYQGFSITSYTKADFTFSQKTIRILSGLYGCLRPLDLIQPYRLEMKTKISNKRGKNLYEFWNEQLTTHLNKDLKKHKYTEVINLASIEYSKSIDLQSLSAKIINVDFKVKKGRELKTIGIYAKKARGLMANYIVKNKILSSKKLPAFSEDGYCYDKKLSDSDTMTFIKKV